MQLAIRTFNEVEDFNKFVAEKLKDENLKITPVTIFPAQSNLGRAILVIYYTSEKLPVQTIITHG